MRKRSQKIIQLSPSPSPKRPLPPPSRFLSATANHPTLPPPHQAIYKLMSHLQETRQHGQQPIHLPSADATSPRSPTPPSVTRPSLRGLRARRGFGEVAPSAHAEEDGEGGLRAHRRAAVVAAGEEGGQRAGFGGRCDDLVHALRGLLLWNRLGGGKMEQNRGDVRQPGGHRRGRERGGVGLCASCVIGAG